LNNYGRRPLGQGQDKDRCHFGKDLVPWWKVATASFKVGPALLKFLENELAIFNRLNTIFNEVYFAKPLPADPYRVSLFQFPFPEVSRMIAQLSKELVWSRIVARAWCDEALLKRLLSDPRGVLAEHDLEAPPGTEVEVVLGPEVDVIDTEMGRRFVLPASPPDDLTEEDLFEGPVAYCRCAACGRCGACGCRCRC
jgi:hypothetical protein